MTSYHISNDATVVLITTAMSVNKDKHTLGFSLNQLSLLKLFHQKDDISKKHNEKNTAMCSEVILSLLFFAV